VDEFNYGIHAYSMLAGILGAGATSVQHLSRGVQRRIQVNWDDGRTGILVIGQAGARRPSGVSSTAAAPGRHYR
jgi:hypothetical protein